MPRNYVSSITIDSSGIKWIGTAGGLVKFDNNNFTVYDSLNSGLPHNAVSAIAIDTLGNKWIGTSGGGLAIYKEGGVVAIKDKKPSVIGKI